ncbi:hypothetical protein T4B_11903 [Trichinella pseudospiralis]|uniref:Uncharacterized protein n=2 Tax=Trichinella pseudospiralis TaxID=6337 RepID=A0A0V1HB43_TRIPS|nr:hypothetical protein T4B_11903 [Trichinella pseudospiralis]
MEGIFKVVPQRYQQLFITHATMAGKLVPAVYCLYTGKDTRTFGPDIRNSGLLSKFAGTGLRLTILLGADRGRHEADRGRHEAELYHEDIRYMWFPKGPNFVGSNRSLVNYVRWSVTFGAQSEVSEDTLDGEDAICPSRV